MSELQDKRDEKIGGAIVNISWWIFAAKFLVIVTVIAGIVLYLIHKPLWIAPLIGIGHLSYIDSSGDSSGCL